MVRIRLPLCVACVEPINDTVGMASGNLNHDIQRRVKAGLRLTPEERILAGIKQSELSIRVVEEGIRDRYPGADEATIASHLLERIRMMKRIQNRRLGSES